MDLLSLEQDRALVVADFAFYGLMATGAAALMLDLVPAGHAWQAVGWMLTGVAGWTLVEYLLHRFVLHRVQPFKRWHALHHARPQAMIATPTLLTAALFALLVVLPAWWLLPAWRAAALVSGVLLGYVGYIVLHHAVHHGSGAMLRRPKRWHALHHRAGARACYGVSVPLWDHLFRSMPPDVRQRTDAAPARR
jgi:cyclopropane-fatty-acyl-phospholipid synthase